MALAKNRLQSKVILVIAVVLETQAPVCVGDPRQEDRFFRSPVLYLLLNTFEITAVDFSRVQKHAARKPTLFDVTKDPDTQ